MQPRVQRCRLTKRSTDGFVVKRLDGIVFTLPLTRVLGVGVSVVLDHPSLGRETLFVDIVTSWGIDGSGPVVLRMDSTGLPLHRLIGANVGHIAAIKLLATELAGSPNCRKLPSREDWPGPPFSRYANELALDQALYGWL